MKINVLPEDFLKSPKGFYGDDTCPLHNAFVRVTGKECSVTITRIYVRDLSKAFLFKDWTELSKDEPIVQGIHYSLGREEQSESIARVNQWWADVKAGKEIPNIEVEIVDYQM